MDYLQLLERQPAQKLALITEQRPYTYGDLAAQARSIRQQLGTKRGYYVIASPSIALQLCLFLAYSGTAVVPIIGNEQYENVVIDEGDIPQAACMGVMTSGTTGTSKILWRTYESWADFFPIQNEVFAITVDTVLFCHGSLAFTGNLNLYLGVLAVGGTIIGTMSFRPRSWLHLIETYHGNAIYLIPTKLLLLPQAARKTYPMIAHIISGSQSLGAEKASRLKEIFPHSDITLYYGASELNYITYVKDDDMTDDASLVGRPFDGVSIAIDEETKEIQVTTAYHVMGITCPYTLHDRGRIDEEGRLYFLGRTHDLCNLNGRHLSLYAVEEALKAQLPIGEVVVFVRERDDADELVAVFGGMTEPLTRTAIRNRMRPYLQDYEIPKVFYAVDELPKNDSGKMIRRKAAQLNLQNIRRL